MMSDWLLVKQKTPPPKKKTKTNESWLWVGTKGRGFQGFPMIIILNNPFPPPKTNDPKIREQSNSSPLILCPSTWDLEWSGYWKRGLAVNRVILQRHNIGNKKCHLPFFKGAPPPNSTLYGALPATPFQCESSLATVQISSPCKGAISPPPPELRSSLVALALQETQQSEHNFHAPKSHGLKRLHHFTKDMGIHMIIAGRF